MANYYSIKIPKPCHEGWDTMTPKEKGRFCGSCNKTVVDFTTMDTHQIQGFLKQNKDQHICGHIKQTQLDSINLRIPLSLIQQKHNVYKSFFLAAMIVMGTSLFSCSSKNGKPQKIDSVEVVDSTKNEVVDVLGRITTPEKTVSTSIRKINPPPIPEIKGALIIDSIITGDLIIENKNKEVIIDSLDIEKPIDFTVEGEMIIMGEIEAPVLKEPFPITNIEKLPKFKNTPQNLTNKEELKYFNAQLSQFVKANFKTDKFKNLGLKGTQRVQVMIEISNTGVFITKKTRAFHPLIEKEAKRVINMLPKITPATNAGQVVSTIFTLPIAFKAEEE